LNPFAVSQTPREASHTKMGRLSQGGAHRTRRVDADDGGGAGEEEQRGSDEPDGGDDVRRHLEEGRT
jgi:hypothetical protein